MKRLALEAEKEGLMEESAKDQICDLKVDGEEKPETVSRAATGGSSMAREAGNALERQEGKKTPEWELPDQDPPPAA